VKRLQLIRNLWIINCLAFVLSGCAHFTTKQTDLRNGETTTITTKVTGWTFFDSKSQLANFKASQTEKTQGASVGSLTQETNGTNVAATVTALAELMKAIAK
jgi:hypothetical protein